MERGPRSAETVGHLGHVISRHNYLGHGAQFRRQTCQIPGHVDAETLKSGTSSPLLVFILLASRQCVDPFGIITLGNLAIDRRDAFGQTAISTCWSISCPARALDCWAFPR